MSSLYLGSGAMEQEIVLITMYVWLQKLFDFHR